MNFDYLKPLIEQIPDFAGLHTYCNKAEIFQKMFPEESVNNARKALEWLVKTTLKIKGVAEAELDTTLNSMINRPEMQSFINYDSVLDNAIKKVRLIGNNGSHVGMMVTKINSYVCLRNLYDVVAGFLMRWGAIKTIAPFSATAIPDTLPGMTVMTTPEPEVSAAVVASVPKENVEHPATVVLPSESLESEAITRKYLIDYMLQEAGWTVLEEKGLVKSCAACIELEVSLTPGPSPKGEGSFPSKSGKGYADYVLMGRNCKPLAVIEAKSTSHEVGEGRRQALLYADCLEKKYGQRPVIYYTNGYQTKVIDGLGYMDRSVYSFHSLDDLERLIQKRGRADIRDLRINGDITNRDYQKTAIKNLVEWLNKKHRRGLLVLATGTGKTRVSISLCDVLMRNDWVKNVLFLADRTALVNQAHKNYEQLLPQVSMSVLSEEREPDMQARIVFSTYQTMISYIDREDKPFSIGRFDLIIIDEAHRSVFGRYGSIFKYFDSLLIGLTATPRNEIDKSTYELLELDEGVPNYEYTLEEAIADKYLTDYKLLPYHSKIMESGIKYDELTQAQRDNLEKVWTYEKAINGIDEDEEYSRDIASQEIFSYLFNQDTIDKVLQALMEKGLRVRSGEDIGKSIIFAINHDHAVQIVERFRALYPEKGEKYCQLIDNRVKYANSLILEFGEVEKLPQIAVSVDMLDTGVDVPSILNLVFFKTVRSKIKFMQMIGRGTRLCKDVFGPGKDKKFFYIFDWCNNFEYFSINKEGAEGVATPLSLTERLFSLRLEIAFALQTAEHQQIDFDRQLHDELKQILWQEVSSLSKARIDVREKLDVIEPFRSRGAWTCLSAGDVAKLQGIAALLPRSTENEAAKKFDVLILKLQLEQVDESAPNADKCRKRVMTIANLLGEKASLPLVKQHLDTILEVQKVEYWEEISLDRLEHVRKELRELVHLLEEGREDRKFIIDIEDITTADAQGESIELRATYRQRVIEYLARNSQNPVLKKIQDFEQLTPSDINELQRVFWEELGTQEEYMEEIHGKPYLANVAAFIRVINGIDRQKALDKYSKFIANAPLNSRQEEYLKEILNFVSVNGDVQPSDIAGPLLKHLDWVGAFGSQMMKLKECVEDMHGIISA